MLAFLSFITKWPLFSFVLLHGCLKRLFIYFLTKMLYYTSQEVGNPVQIIKYMYVELSRFQPILRNAVTFVESLFTLKPFKAVYW